ncbi:Protein MON2 [Nymphon striatum]|nr:Protein MON2 [Nymphon striatum]
MWPDLAATFSDFLFTSSLPPPTQSLEDQQRDEAMDCKVMIASFSSLIVFERFLYTDPFAAPQKKKSGGVKSGDLGGQRTISLGVDNVIDLIRNEILPHSEAIPKHFVLKIMAMLNQGSIHSATNNVIAVDIESSRKLREDFAKSCFETLLQFSFLGSSPPSQEMLDANLDGEGNTIISKLAITALLQRFKEVIRKFAEDERISGKCPLPRHRMSEISFVLKAIATLAISLKQVPAQNIEDSLWQQVIDLYPHLVECSTSTSSQVCRSLKEALHQYHDLLGNPQTSLVSKVQNGC